MSFQSFKIRRIGNLCASQSFSEDTDVIVLASNLLKKGLDSKDFYTVGNTLNCLSNICTKDLATDLLDDVVGLLNNQKPYLRKKAVLCLYKMYLKYPPALAMTFEQLKSKLEDEDMNVVSAAVCVICELANKKPSNYLALAPFFFTLLKNTNKVWMLIKVVKLLGTLFTVEPRLARKMLEPLTRLITESKSKSLQFECLNTLALALSYCRGSDGSLPKAAPEAAELCLSKLKEFILSSDPNLKYVGLVGLITLMKFDSKIVMTLMDNISDCLDDEDITIRIRALELIAGMKTTKNLETLVEKLMLYVDKTDDIRYRDILIEKVIDMCSCNKYKYMSNFAWYLTILVDLSYMKGSKHGDLIRSQLLDIVIRVPELRQYAVETMLPLLSDVSFLDGNALDSVLCAASWIVGEYPESLTIKQHTETLKILLRSEILNVQANIQALFIQCVIKLYISLVKKLKSGEDGEESEDSLLLKLREVGLFIVSNLEPYVRAYDVEVQERASSIQSLLMSLDPCLKIQIKHFRKMNDSKNNNNNSKGGINPPPEPESEMPELVDDEGNPLPTTESGIPKHDLMLLSDLEFNEIAPVSSKAQKKVPVPEGLDLDKWIGEEFDMEDRYENNESSSEQFVDIQFIYHEAKVIKGLPGENIELTEEELRKQNPNYLQGGSDDEIDGYQEEIEVVELKPEDLDGEKLTPISKGRHHRSARNTPKISYTVRRDDDSGSSDEDDKKKKHSSSRKGRGSSVNDISDIDLNKPQHFQTKKKDSRYKTPAELEKEKEMRLQKMNSRSSASKSSSNVKDDRHHHRESSHHHHESSSHRHESSRHHHDSSRHDHHHESSSKHHSDDKHHHRESSNHHPHESSSHHHESSRHDHHESSSHHHSDEKPKVEKPREEKPREEKPREEKPREEKPKDDKSKEEKPKVEKPKEEKPKEEKPKVEKPKTEKPKVEKPKEDKPKEERPKEDKPKEDKPKTEKSTKPKTDSKSTKSSETKSKTTPKATAKKSSTPKAAPKEKTEEKPIEIPKEPETTPEVKSEEKPKDDVDDLFNSNDVQPTETTASSADPFGDDLFTATDNAAPSNTADEDFF